MVCITCNLSVSLLDIKILSPDFSLSLSRARARTNNILANRPDLVGTVPTWRPKPDIPPDDPKKPIRPDLSRSTPQNTILNPLFACSLCSSVGIQVSSVSFGLFFMYPSVAGSCPNRKSVHIRALFRLKSSFSCHFPLNARNFVNILAYSGSHLFTQNFV